MSTIFNLFGGTNVTPRGQQKMGSTDLLGKFNARTPLSGGGPLKHGSASKPRGLSIRSKNDLNVCTPNTPTATKGKFKTMDCAMRPSTPHQKETVSKLQVVREKQLKSLSPTSKSPFFNLTLKQKGTEDLLFKKPVTPKNKQKKRHVCPEPEGLAPYVDDDFYLNAPFPLENSITNIFKEEPKPFELWRDEGFESDPELISPPMSPVKFDRSNSPGFDIDLEAPEIPMIPDSDDDF